MKKQYNLEELTPSLTVKELDRYIIGQDEAKKAVAVALRDRYRRSQLSEEDREEITPKNIILMGPTGVGKTEITRRIAKLVNAPLVKVEATKFTEVGYVGRDVESMIRDLVARAVHDAEQMKINEVKEIAEKNAEKELINLIAGLRKVEKKNSNEGGLSIPFLNSSKKETPEEKEERLRRIQEKKSKRAKIKEDLEAGKLEDDIVTIIVKEKPTRVLGMVGGMDDMNINEMFGGLIPEKTKKRNMKVSEARKILFDQEASKLIDKDEVTELGLRNAEQNGIIFIDEIDKIIGSDGGHGPDVSREGVQRDILPIVEGSTVNTKFGPIKTDFILFIGSGAFHGKELSEMIPELQGRFPVNVRLSSLTKENFEEILTNTENSMLKQYKQLLGVEGIKLEFTEDAVKEIAQIAYDENMNNEDIGARRLQTVLEKLLEDISFNAPDLENKNIVITGDFVKETLNDEIKHNDYKQYLI